MNTTGTYWIHGSELETMPTFMDVWDSLPPGKIVATSPLERYVKLAYQWDKYTGVDSSMAVSLRNGMLVHVSHIYDRFRKDMALD